ncbi:hypothetical protein Tco_1194952 [Tanacetum coccineum]
MSQDQSIPRRNKVDLHMANYDPILTTMRFIPQHEVVQKYGAIFLDYLITPAMKESEAFKTYYAFATGKATPKLKYVRHTSKDKAKQAPKASTGKRLKAAAKGAKSDDDDDDNEGNDDADNDDHDDADIQCERTKSDNEGDAFVHLNFTTHEEEESSNRRVHTPSQSEPSNTEANVDVAQSKYTNEEEVNVEHTYEEEDANDLYRDLNVNLEGRDADMTDAPQITKVIEDTHVTLTPVNHEGQQQSSSPICSTQTQTQELTPFLTLSQPLLLKALEQGFLEFIQTNQYATALSSIPNIIDNYLGSKLKQAVDVAVQLNQDISCVDANLSELELKKILIDKMKSNKSIDIFDEQENQYKALVDAYEADKALLDTYGDTVTIKRCRYNANDDQEPSAGIDQGSKRRRAGNEPESSSAPREKNSMTTGKCTEGSKSHQQSAGQSAPAEVPMYTVDDFEDPTHQEFDTGLNDDQLKEEAHPHLNWFQQPSKLPSPNRVWNKTVPADHGPVQP